MPKKQTSKRAAGAKPQPTLPAKAAKARKSAPKPRHPSTGAGGAKRKPARAVAIAETDALNGFDQSRVEGALVSTKAERRRSGEPSARTSRMPVSTASEQSGKYVYCIIEAKEALRFGKIGIGAEPAEVHTVNYKDIAAVVSDTPIEVYDPTRENVLAHERVNETVMREQTVIPMSFGTVFKTSDDIIELLRSAYDAFRDVLVKMQNKVEFGLKVLWDPDAIIGELEKEDENVRRLREELSSQQGSTYFARMQYGRLVDSLLQERSERYVSEIFAALREASVASRANKPIGDRMIMNAAFLVSRDEESAFDAQVKKIGGQLDHLTFKYTGPWPPYNFVNIRLKLERARDAE